MVTAVDTNVLSALLIGGPEESAAARDVLTAAARSGELVISPIVYAELRAAPRGTEAEVGVFLSSLRVEVVWTVGEGVWRDAAAAFSAYAARRRVRHDGMPKRFLADFLVGAHACWLKCRLLTFDQGKYRAAFPELELVP
ncbi:MAG TPA: type II toxin-antitoxin system VapC family toxin [Trueperaceae bacterium]|nr:type II toxin-antitoxin system VapC family toxin [Trueperaceae bacterium]